MTSKTSGSPPPRESTRITRRKNRPPPFGRTTTKPLPYRVCKLRPAPSMSALLHDDNDDKPRNPTDRRVLQTVLEVAVAAAGTNSKRPSRTIGDSPCWCSSCCWSCSWPLAWPLLAGPWRTIAVMTHWLPCKTPNRGLPAVLYPTFPRWRQRQRLRKRIHQLTTIHLQNQTTTTLRTMPIAPTRPKSFTSVSALDDRIVPGWPPSRHKKNDSVNRPLRE